MHHSPGDPMSAQSHPLVIRDLVKSFRQGAAAVPVLSGVTFTACRGEFIALMGPSGSGKSTLLHCIAGLTGHDSGQIHLNDELVSGLPDRRLTEIRRKQLGFIFQSFNLLPNLNVRDNICLPVLAAGAKVDAAFLQSIAERLGIADKLSRRPGDLSGGEQQRVAIARMSPPAAWTATPGRNSAGSSSAVVQMSSRPYCWSPMRQRWPCGPSGSWFCSTVPSWGNFRSPRG